MRKLIIVTLVFFSMLTITPIVGRSSVHAQAFGQAQSSGPSHVLNQATPGSGNLLYHGGNILKFPNVYITFWGWSINPKMPPADPNGEGAYLGQFFSGIGGSSWLNTVTQYSSNLQGHIINWPNQLSGTWTALSGAIPANPTPGQIAAEALRSAIVWGYPADAVYIIATPHNHTSSDILKGGACAWHSWT